MQTIYAQRILSSGPDAANFLQGQLTCDINALVLGKTIYGAYSNIKGRIDSFMRITLTEIGYEISLPSDQVEFTFDELKKYSVFSKVELQIIDQPAVIDDYAEITQLIPEVYAITRGTFFAHDLNLPALGAVSFTKGCYRGQEIVARMEYRGVPKRGLYRFRSEFPVNVGGELTTATGEIVGTIVRISKHNGILGLAVCQHAVIKENFELYVSGHSVFVDA